MRSIVSPKLSYLPDFTTELKLVEESASVYDWDAATMEAGLPLTTPPPTGNIDPQVPPPPAVLFVEARTVETNVLLLEAYLGFQDHSTGF